MAEFDPSAANVDEVLKKLEKADEQERTRILNAERKGKARTTILDAYNVDPDERTDASGRVLYPWEMEPANHVHHVQVEETEEQRKEREARAEFDARVERSAPTGVDEQQGGTAAGVGVSAPAVAPAAGGAPATGTAGI